MSVADKLYERLLNEQQQRIRQLEALIDQQTALSTPLVRDHTALREDDQQGLEVALKEHAEQLAGLQRELSRRESEWSLRHDQAAAQQQAWLEQLDRLYQNHVAIGSTAERKQLDAERREVQRHREQLAQTLAKTVRQRNKLSRLLRAERSKLLSASQRQQADIAKSAAIETARLQKQISDSAARIAVLQEVIDCRDKQCADLSQQLMAMQQQHAEQLRQLNGAQAALEEARENHNAEREQLQRQRFELHAQCAELHRQRERLKQQQLDTNQQRRRLGRQLRARRAELLAELDRRRAALAQLSARKNSRIAQQLAISSADCERVREQLARHKQRGDELAAQLEKVQAQSEHELTEARAALDQARNAQQSLQQQLDEHRHLLERREKDLGQLRNQLQQSAGGQANEAPSGAVSKRLDEVRGERDALLKRLTHAEARLKEVQSACNQADEIVHLQRRFELAVQDVVDLKAQNSDLEEELAQARQALATALTEQQHSVTEPELSEECEVKSAVEPRGVFDWEAQKQRLMAQVEADFDADDQQKEHKMTVAGTIRITDQVVAEKDREIRRLKRLLEQQSGPNKTPTAAPTTAELLDHDESIRRERANLKQLQDEWREKLRRAEVDISIERAKLARERVQLDDRIRVYEQRLAEYGGEPKSEEQNKEPTRGRWLVRLGLKE
jgi:hypothetical protein